jgi:hypothetical protein
MKRLLIAGALALALSGCALTGGVKGFHADAERADTDASLAYVGIASAVDAYKAAPGTDAGQDANAEVLKRRAWEVLKGIHVAYAAGQAIDLTPLQDLARQVQALKAHQ